MTEARTTSNDVDTVRLVQGQAGGAWPLVRADVLRVDGEIRWAAYAAFGSVLGSTRHRARRVPLG